MKKANIVFIFSILLLALLAAFDFKNSERRSLNEIISLYESLSKENISSQGQEKLSTLKCRRDGGFSYLGLNAFECEMETVCEASVKHILLYTRFRGAFFGPDPFSEGFVRKCPKMLTHRALAEISAKLDQGG